jgi:hypothetical protein
MKDVFLSLQEEAEEITTQSAHINSDYFTETIKHPYSASLNTLKYLKELAIYRQVFNRHAVHVDQNFCIQTL